MPGRPRGSPGGITLPLGAALALTAACPALPRLVAARAHRRQGADPARLPERWGTASAPRPPGPLVWVHAASVGEVAAARDLAADLAAEAGAALLVTTTTDGGRRAAPPGAIHQFAPVDTPGAVGRFLDHWRPSLGAFVEGDLWPRLVLASRRRGVPLALLNARASRTRARLPRSMGMLLARMSVITAQDEGVRRDLLALGLDPARVHATGDLRAAADPLPADREELAALGAGLGLRPAWAAVSTHPADEAAVLGAHAAARADVHPDLLLWWLPRHPARGDAIEAAARGAGLPVARRSRGEPLAPATALYLADTLGEAGLFMRLAPVVFLGGSFGAEGGHNPYEPARLGAAVLTGPRVAHHRGSFARLEEAGAARVVVDGAELGRAVAELASGPALRAMQEAGLAVMAAGADARSRTLGLLRPLLAPGPPAP